MEAQAADSKTETKYYRVGDLILNANTNRLIKVGGVTYKKLLKRGVDMPPYYDPSVLADAPSDPAKAKELIKKLDAELPRSQQAIHGKGEHAGKIVKRSKPISGLDAARYTVKLAAQAVASNINEICEEPGDDGDLINLVEHLILKEMTVGLKDVPPPRRRPGRPRKDEVKYVEAPIPETPRAESESESESDTKATIPKSTIRRARMALKIPESDADPGETTAAETTAAVEETEPDHSESADAEYEMQADAWAAEIENWEADE